MSAGSLHKLARLAGSAVMPPSWLYDGQWPSRLRRGLQIVLALLSWIVSFSRSVVLTGRGLPAATGRVTVRSYPRLLDFMDGVLVLPGASLNQLSSALEINSQSAPEIYLADAGVLVLLTTKDTKPIVIHVTEDWDRVMRYQKGLELARCCFSMTGHDHLIPRVLDCRQHLDYWILRQERLSGTVKRAQDLNVHGLVSHVSAALKVLPRCPQHFQAYSDYDGDQNPWNVLLEHPATAPLVNTVVDYEQSIRNSPSCHVQFAHGDYCISNVLYDSGLNCGEPVITGIIDWERAKSNAPVGYDALYFSIFAFASWKGCSPMIVLCMLWDDNIDAILKSLLDLIMAEFSLTLEDLKFTAVHLWLAHLCRQIHGIHDWSSVRRLEWLIQPSQSANRWIDHHA